jgi:hypothetical protein
MNIFANFLNMFKIEPIFHHLCGSQDWKEVDFKMYTLNCFSNGDT